jgi:hypothetical protein
MHGSGIRRWASVPFLYHECLKDAIRSAEETVNITYSMTGTMIFGKEKVRRGRIRRGAHRMVQTP